MVLQSKRLLLKPVDLSDLETLHNQFIDPVVRRYLWDDESIPLQKTDDLIRQSISQFRQEKCGLWMIYLDKKLPIGFTGLWYFFSESQPELLFGLLPEYHGQGLATEAAGLIISYAFAVLGFDYLDGATDEPNRKSRLVMQRAGMSLLKTESIEGKSTVFYQVKNPAHT